MAAIRLAALVPAEPYEPPTRPVARRSIRIGDRRIGAEGDILMLVVSRPYLALVVAMLGSACGPPHFGGGTAGDEVSDSTSDSTDLETGATDSTSETSSETSSETTGEPVCGDGIVDPGEECDVGPDNAWELADCQPDCTLNECGDGLRGPGECESPSCVSDCPPILCGDKVFACGDLIDNDRDGASDLYDPDCFGPCDDSEDSLAPQLPGSELRCNLDCFFDDNSGMGDDMCEWNLECDPQSPGELFGCLYDPLFAMEEAFCPSTQDVECLNLCLPLVANGCDCFGCCELAGQFRYLIDYSECNVDNLEGCPPCTPNLDCFNPCEPENCELCLLAELAPGCDQSSCPDGVAPCTDPYECGEGEFCQTGCCRPTLLGE